MKLAILYAGQGSQHPGMGKDLYERYPAFREAFNAADLDFDLESVCFDDPEGVLNLTQYTQPCMVAFAAGVTAVLKENGVKADYLAGLSLGEYSALEAAGVFTAKQAVELAAFRGKAMADAGLKASDLGKVLDPVADKLTQAAALACLIVVVACNYIFKSRNKKSGIVLEYCLLFPWLLPTILICYSYRTYFNSDAIWYVGDMNLYYAENVRLLIVLAYTVVKLPFSLRMIKAAFYSIDSELEDAARNMGASGLRTFLKVKLPIILPSVLAVFALNFNALFTEYDMSATFASSYGTTYAMVIQSMCEEEGLYGYNVNASGRRCASTVFIMLVSGLILYLVYGVGGRDLGERLDAKARRKRIWSRMTGVFRRSGDSGVAEPGEQL